MNNYEVIVVHLVKADTPQEAQKKADNGEYYEKYVSAVLQSNRIKK